MSRILVTGAAGFVGSHTVDRLLAEGHAVAGVDNLRTGRLENLSAALRHPAFAFHHRDLMEPGWLAKLAAEFEPDAIVHLAALVSVPESFSDPALNRRLNFDATTLVGATALAGKHPARIVFASSAAVYGTFQVLPLTEQSPCVPISPYGQAKLDSEAWLLARAREHRGLVVRCHRYFNVYGPRQDPSSPYSGVISRFADALARHQPPTIFGDGEQTRDFVSVFDVARANVLAATAGNISSGVANICTGQAVSLNALHAAMSRALGKNTAARHLPARTGDIRHSCGSGAAAARELGFAATVTLAAGLGQLLAPSA